MEEKGVNMILGWLFQSSLHYSYSVAIYAVGLVLTFAP